MTWLLHGLHGGLIIAGSLAVLALLRAPATGARRLSDLRAAASAGRLVEDAERRAERLLRPPLKPARTLVVVALASLGAATVHAVVGPGHFAEGLRFGLFFAALSGLQVATAVQVLRRPARPLVLATALLNCGVVLVWLLSRTVGLPFGLAAVEPVGVLDVLASICELAVVAAAARWLAGSSARRPVGAPAHRYAGVRR